MIAAFIFGLHCAAWLAGFIVGAACIGYPAWIAFDTIGKRVVRNWRG